MYFDAEAEHRDSFPIVSWGKTEATFLSASQDIPDKMEILASLVFAISEGKFVVADITDRGWCIPGGHLYPGESPEAAVRREAYEEAGITLGALHFLGNFLMKNSTSNVNQIVPTYVSEVIEFASIPEGTESRGIRLLTLEELPENYFVWDGLMDAVFHCALELFNR